ncbi:MAG: hypothetical protein H6Q60_1030 [Oscillospiraceae bacterium]|nr:hypothetical protein [Oscillospiraceae bacterium]
MLFDTIRAYLGFNAKQEQTRQAVLAEAAQILSKAEEEGRIRAEHARTEAEERVKTLTEEADRTAALRVSELIARIEKDDSACLRRAETRLEDAVGLIVNQIVSG